MDLITELEGMAANAACHSSDGDCVTDTDVERWQHCFGLPYTSARAQLEEFRGNLGRLRVSDELWNIVKEDRKTKGFDREAYEFSLQNQGSRRPSVPELSICEDSNRSYIMKLEGLLGTAEAVRIAAQLTYTPESISGAGEAQDVQFCKIDGTTRQKILIWAAGNQSNFWPTIVRLSKSPKCLSHVTLAPTLGTDTTLPHHRPSSTNFVPQPSQDQYPVWYFVYGNLAKPFELQQRLDLPGLPEYAPAHIYGGEIRSWRGRYRALVNADSSSRVDGSAYLVATKEHEERLQFYETEKYEIVRCLIHMNGGVVDGLVFRFAGADAELH